MLAIFHVRSYLSLLDPVSEVHVHVGPSHAPKLAQEILVLGIGNTKGTSAFWPDRIALVGNS